MTLSQKPLPLLTVSSTCVDAVTQAVWLLLLLLLPQKEMQPAVCIYLSLCWTIRSPSGISGTGSRNGSVPPLPPQHYSPTTNDCLAGDTLYNARLLSKGSGLKLVIDTGKAGP